MAGLPQFHRLPLPHESKENTAETPEEEEAGSFSAGYFGDVCHYYAGQDSDSSDDWLAAQGAEDAAAASSSPAALVLEGFDTFFSSSMIPQPEGSCSIEANESKGSLQCPGGKKKDTSPAADEHNHCDDDSSSGGEDGNIQIRIAPPRYELEFAEYLRHQQQLQQQESESRAESNDK